MILRSKRAQSITAEACNGMPYVKICGTMQPEHALVATECGADMIGMVFAESRRQVSVETATRIAGAVRSANRRPMLVGVFVNETPERTMEIAQAVGLDLLQLSGDESPDVANKSGMRYPIIKAMRFPAGSKRGADES